MGREAKTREFLKSLPGGQRLPHVPLGGGLLIGGSGKPPIVHDAFGRVLEVGDLVILPSENVAPFTVAAIEEAPAGTHPPGIDMVVTLNCQVRFLAPRTGPQREFTRVMTREERGIRQEQPVDAGRPPGPEDEIPPQEPEEPSRVADEPQEPSA